MSKVIYQDPIQSTSGKLFGKKQNLSQRKLFGIYETTYCYKNKPAGWSDAQTLHRQKMGAASLYAKLLLLDPDFAARATACRMELMRRAANPRSAADKRLKPYLRNQQMLTSLIYSRISADDTLAAPLLDGYARYAAASPFDRPAVLSQLAVELVPLAPSLRSVILAL
ncbi:MAG: hypothetical protein II970_08450 [Paludibacteraceae bacterium]|nr:hypothetical protein [Paludibacteraceae bacterium]